MSTDLLVTLYNVRMLSPCLGVNHNGSLSNLTELSNEGLATVSVRPSHQLSVGALSLSFLNVIVQALLLSLLTSAGLLSRDILPVSSMSCLSSLANRNELDSKLLTNLADAIE
jgi:hypothetical protein